MTGRRIALGVVGASAQYGWAMRAHLPAYQALPEYELVAVCTAHKETAEASAQHWGAKRAYWDYQELVNDLEIEVVDVCVRAPLHYEIAMAALRAGKHVFCEWPLAANSAQADHLAALAQERGVRTMVGLQSRYAPSFLRFKELVEEGYLGQLLSCNMTMFLGGVLRPRPESATWSTQVGAGASTLSIATGHALDVFLWCLGEFAELSASVSTQVKQLSIVGSERKVEVTSPDNVLVLGRLVNGAVASVHVGSIPWHGTAFRMEAYGTDGTLIATSNQMVEMIDPRLRGGRQRDPALEEMPPDPRLRLVPAELAEGVAVNVGQMFRRFGEAIRTGVEAQPNFQEAARRQHTLDAIRRASESGAWVALE